MSSVSFLASTLSILFFFFFNDTATTEIYTLSLHDALPICIEAFQAQDTEGVVAVPGAAELLAGPGHGDRKSTRLNSSHLGISYAVFCLKKKKKNKRSTKITDLSESNDRRTAEPPVREHDQM